MSLLEFVASLVSSLAWPAVVLAGLLLFRRGIRSRIADIRRVAWGDKVVDFTERLDRIESEAVTLVTAAEETLPAPHDHPGSPADAQDAARFEVVLEAEPRLAVVDTWASIEREMQRVAVERGYGPKAKSATFVMRRLIADGILDRETGEVLDALRLLRNDVVHLRHKSVSVEDARRYRELAGLVISKLRATD
jgi:hypothetical protein